MIEFKNISKSFGSKKVLDDVSFTINKGETFVLIGPSGTGKSVSLNHMIAQLTPDQGQILIDGVDIHAANQKEKAQVMNKFGVLFQSGALLAWLTVAENIALPLVENTKLKKAEIDEKVQKVIKMVQLDGAENKFPSEISGGMKKRAGLARAIVTNPEIILYDEPTSGLDPVMSRHIDKMTLDMQKELNVTSVVVTHDLHSAFSIADRIAMLHKGKIGEIATPEDFVKSDKDFVQEFIKAQFSKGKLQGFDL